MKHTERKYDWGTMHFEEYDVGRVEYTVGIDYLYINLIYVELRCRDIGCGARFLKDLIKKARSMRKSAVYLLVDVQNEEGIDRARLMDWYKRYGFEEVEDLDDLPFNYNMRLRIGKSK